MAANEAMRQSRLVLVTVENRCSVTPEGTELPLIQVEIDKDVVNEICFLILDIVCFTLCFS